MEPSKTTEQEDVKMPAANVYAPNMASSKVARRGREEYDEDYSTAKPGATYACLGPDLNYSTYPNPTRDGKGMAFTRQCIIKHFWYCA